MSRNDDEVTASNLSARCKLGSTVSLEHVYLHQRTAVECYSAEQKVNALGLERKEQMSQQEELSRQDLTALSFGKDIASETVAKAKGRGRVFVRPALSACGQCRRRKTRCSAQRPICSSCIARGLNCSWDVVDGLTRYEDLTLKVQEAEMRLNHLCVLVGALRTGSNQTSTMLLAKLRLGVSIEELVRSLPPALAGSAGLESYRKQ